MTRYIDILHRIPFNWVILSLNLYVFEIVKPLLKFTFLNKLYENKVYIIHYLENKDVNVFIWNVENAKQRHVLILQYSGENCPVFDALIHANVGPVWGKYGFICVITSNIVYLFCQGGKPLVCRK